MLELLNELDLGQDGTLGSIQELQKFLNGNLESGATRLHEDDRLGPLSVNAIRDRLIARIGQAALRVQFLPLINSAQVLFQDMRATSAELGGRHGQAAPDLYVNPLYDGELRGILQARIRAASNG